MLTEIDIVAFDKKDGVGKKLLWNVWDHTQTLFNIFALGILR